MAPTLRSFAVCATLLLWGGCAPYEVRIPYLKAVSEQAGEQAAALQNVYLLIRASPPNAIDPAPPRYAWGKLAAQLAKEVSQCAGRLVAWRLSERDPDPFLEALSPSATLVVDVHPAEFWSQETREEIQKGDHKEWATHWVLPKIEK